MAKRKNNLKRYRKYAEICSKTVYSDRVTIRANNRAVAKMYEIVDEAIQQGKPAVDELATLLDEPLSTHWLAHQLLEKANLNTKTEQKCLSII